MELGWTYPLRKKHLNDLINTPVPADKKITKSIKFQGEMVHLQQYKVPIELPKYRLSNGRTYAAQAQYLAIHEELDEDFFSSDPESDAAMLAQHSILVEMISEKGLLEELEKNGQNDPLILSSEGYVVNGNRRLCAMRELIKQGRNVSHKFTNISIVILPKCTEKDIDILEANLQLKKDVKADYTWYTQALMFRNRMREHGYSETELTEIYGNKDVNVEELLDLLGYGEDYLKERNSVGHYGLLKEKYYAFKELRKTRKKKRAWSDAEKDLFTQLAYCVVDISKGQRAYEAIPKLADNIPEIIDELTEEFPELAVGESDDPDDDSDILGGGEIHVDKSLIALIDHFKLDSTKDTARNIIDDVLTAAANRKKEKNRKNYVLSQVKKANTALSDAVNGMSHETSKSGVEAQLENVKANIVKIDKWLQQ